MQTAIYIDPFAEAWREVQAEPVRTLQRCSLSPTPRCSRRPRARRARARARRRRTAIRGRSADPGSDGDGPGPRTPTTISTKTTTKVANPIHPASKEIKPEPRAPPQARTRRCATMNARFNHRAAIARCIDDADEAQWFAAHPDRQYYLRPSCPAEIKRRRLILPDHTPRKLEPGCRWFMLAIRTQARRVQSPAHAVLRRHHRRRR